MKKIVYAVIAIAMLITIPTQAFAEEEIVGKKMFVNSEYGYTYSEEFNEDNNPVRIYENPSLAEISEQLDMFQRISTHNVEISNEEKYAKIKSVLNDLGMPVDISDNLPEQSLESYCSSPKIATTEVTSSSNRKFNEEVTSEEDGVYTMWFTYAFLFDEDYNYATYKLSVYHNWSNDVPLSYGESLGIAVTDCIIMSEEDTLLGFHSYKKCTYNIDGTRTLDKSVRVDDDVELFLGSSVCGAGIKFQYPQGNYSTSALTGNKIGTSYVGCYSYLEMIVIVKQYTVAQYFNAMATYDHLVEYYSVIPSLTISAGTSGVDLSVGFTVEKSTDKETKKLTFPSGIQYVPIGIN